MKRNETECEEPFPVPESGRPFCWDSEDGEEIGNGVAVRKDRRGEVRHDAPESQPRLWHLRQMPLQIQPQNLSLRVNERLLLERPGVW